jgi:hypothetical protein
MLDPCHRPTPAAVMLCDPLYSLLGRHRLELTLQHDHNVDMFVVTAPVVAAVLSELVALDLEQLASTRLAGEPDLRRGKGHMVGGGGADVATFLRWPAPAHFTNCGRRPCGEDVANAIDR